MALSGRAAKAKGYRGEVEVLGILSGILAEEYARAGLGGAPELARSPAGRDIRGVSWLALEVKRREPQLVNGVRKDDWNPSILEGWWTQTKTNTLAGQESVLIYRKNHSPWRVRMFARFNTPRSFIRAPVDTSLEAFTTWFRLNVRERLTPAPNESGPACP